MASMERAHLHSPSGSLRRPSASRFLPTLSFLRRTQKPVRASVSGSESRPPARPPAERPQRGLERGGASLSLAKGAKGAQRGSATFFDPLSRRGGVLPSAAQPQAPAWALRKRKARGIPPEFPTQLGVRSAFFLFLAFEKNGDRLPLRFARASRQGCAPHPGKKARNSLRSR